MQRISAKVGVLNDDGSIKSVHVTFRGEPEFTGRVLRDHFTDDVSIAKLYEKAAINIIRTKDRTVKRYFIGKMLLKTIQEKKDVTNL
jgi:hypothetical protein